MSEPHRSVEERLAALEAAVAALQASPPEPETSTGDLWVIDGLREREIAGVVMAGQVEVPDAGPVMWQVARTADDLAQRNWTEFAATIDALAHPVRLMLMQFIHRGIRTTAELQQQEELGTTGQLHHHLRQLVAAGWLTSPRRGRYEVPPERVVPLLTVMLAAIH